MARRSTTSTEEQQRLQEPFTGPVRPWHKWGPYVSERSWGTVCEDYSPDGSAWTFFSHDQARSRAYRWGEDGIAGLCDRYQIMVFALVHLVPHLWFRNTWAWGPEPQPEPCIQLGPTGEGFLSLLADDSTMQPPTTLPFVYRLGPRYLYGEVGARALFTNNETNAPRRSRRLLRRPASAARHCRRAPYTASGARRSAVE